MNREFVLRALTAVGMGAAIVVLAILLWYARRVFLLAFAGILLAVLLQTLAAWLKRFTGLPYRWSVAVVVLALLGGIGLLGWLVGSGVSQQLDELAEALPNSVDKLRDRLDQTTWGKRLATRLPQAAQSISPQDVLAPATGVVSGLLGFLVNLVVILFVGLYGAAQPGWYLHGFLHLFPPPRRERLRHVLQETGDALRWWLIGQLVSMTAVGLLTGLGLWLLGAQLPIALALLAFAMDAIPNLGPILAGVPAILLASAQGPSQALYVALLYVGINAVEGYVLIPLVQMRTVKLPPALLILAVLAFSMLGGPLGALVAAPFLLTIINLVRMLYVEDALGDHSLASEQ
ncbi:MAG TPA: AI-2E family transporter [Pirellulales bacterium]|nr:AI-2E family transporter [Pirellulales bacterium]